MSRNLSMSYLCMHALCVSQDVGVLDTLSLVCVLHALTCASHLCQQDLARTRGCLGHTLTRHAHTLTLVRVVHTRSQGSHTLSLSFSLSLSLSLSLFPFLPPSPPPLHSLSWWPGRTRAWYLPRMVFGMSSKPPRFSPSLPPSLTLSPPPFLPFFLSLSLSLSLCVFVFCMHVCRSKRAYAHTHTHARTHTHTHTH